MSRLTAKQKAQRGWYKRSPWLRHYYHAKWRCERGPYLEKGRKLRMSRDDFKALWLRDKAYEMEHPSIDRIDNSGDYAIENCRFIETLANRRRVSRPILQYTLDGEFVTTYPSLAEAGRKFKCSPTNIQRACAGSMGVKQSHGYVWRYV